MRKAFRQLTGLEANVSWHATGDRNVKCHPQFSVRKRNHLLTKSPHSSRLEWPCSPCQTCWYSKLLHHANLQCVYVYFSMRSLERHHNVRPASVCRATKPDCWRLAPVAAQSGGELAKFTPRRPLVLSNKPATCEADVKGSQDMKITVK